MKTRMRLVGSVALLVLLLSACSPRQDPAPQTPRLRLEITSPTSGGPVSESTVVVTGIVSMPDAKVDVNEIDVEVDEDGGFVTEVPVAYGTNRISIRAEADGYNSTSRSVNVQRILTLTIDSPEDNATISTRRITVAGRVSDPRAEVRVAGTEIAIGEDGRFSTPLDIYYAKTIIPVSAEVEGVAPVSKNLTVDFN